MWTSSRPRKTTSVLDALSTDMNQLHMRPKIILPIESFIAVSVVALEGSALNVLCQNVPP
jgi:hypothetical protein